MPGVGQARVAFALVGREVGHEGSTLMDVDDLDASADAEDRQTGVDRRLDEAKLEVVAFGLDGVGTGCRRRPVAPGVDVGPHRPARCRRDGRPGRRVKLCASAAPGVPPALITLSEYSQKCTSTSASPMMRGAPIRSAPRSRRPEIPMRGVTGFLVPFLGRFSRPVLLARLPAAFAWHRAQNICLRYHSCITRSSFTGTCHCSTPTPASPDGWRSSASAI